MGDKLGVFDFGVLVKRVFGCIRCKLWFYGVNFLVFLF